MTLELVWFVLLAAMLAVYVVLDGFDLGVGALHLLVAREERERRATLRSIGPVWDGNEVWLLAAGGTLVLAFPVLYARGFSGFYLPLIMALWLLVFRALAIELRHHFPNKLWKSFWDVAFAGSSLLLAVILGAALGNIVRGVPRDAEGQFFEPLWTDFGVEAPTGILDWFTVLVGVAGLATLMLHGANWLCAKVDGPPRERAEAWARRLWWVVAVAVLGVTAATFVVQPLVLDNVRARPWGAVFPLTAVLGWVGIALFRRRGAPMKAFLSSAVMIVGLLTSAAFGIFPYVLPGRGEEPGLTYLDAAAPASGLSVALYWWIPGVLLAIGYFWFLYSSLPRTFSVEDDAEH
ncbi:MAG: cytochrome d ubiquinol oxidase subunit II [Myxococcota bacterium]